MIEFLNQNAGALTVMFTAVVTLSTVVYALLTAVLVIETRRMRQAQTEPKVEVVIKSHEEWINLIYVCVRNIGLGPSYDVSFDISAQEGGDGARALIDDFTKANFLRTGLKYLGPGQELVSTFSQVNEGYEQKIVSVLVCDISYKSATRKQYQETFRLDLSEFIGRTQIGKPHLYAITQHLEKIQKDFHYLATGSKRLKTDVYDTGDREQERKELKEWKEQRNEMIGKSNELNTGSQHDAQPDSSDSTAKH